MDSQRQQGKFDIEHAIIIFAVLGYVYLNMVAIFFLFYGFFYRCRVRIQMTALRLGRVADPHHFNVAKSDPTIHSNADSDPAFTLMRIRIRFPLLIKV
jgi:hypothetical protein